MTYRVPFGKITIGRMAHDLVRGTLDRHWITQGRLVQEFEEKFAKKFKWDHAVAVNSGTAAGTIVWAALRELDFPGKWRCRDNDFQVITPASTFTATANCLISAGIRPAFVDIKLDTLNLDPVKVFKEYQFNFVDVGYPDQVLGIQFVASMGKLEGFGALVGWAGHLSIVADLCEAHGASMAGLQINKYVAAAIYSFFVAHLIVCGEGGMICTNNGKLADLCRSVRNHGTPYDRKYFSFDRFGINGRMTDLHAAIGLEQLESFDERFGKRSEVRRKLIQALEPMEDRLFLYREMTGEVIAPHAFPIVVREGSIDRLYNHLHNEAGIECKTLFGSLPTQHRAFNWLNDRGSYPVAERVGRSGLHFSCGEWITDGDIEHIAKAIKEGLN